MRRILVLDDEALIALDLAGVLEDEGFAVCGPYNSVDDALDAIDAHAPDGAILDVNLGQDKTSAPVADRLGQHDIPFAFLTGYEQIDEKLEERHRDRPRLGKPFDRTRIATLVRGMLGN
ncbi:Response regulator receiver domain-containing protein [Roseovarius nanhaiticus]|uniref:Response regulator receiver domain-containing protein n=1 Tax=Roseovarius nanhaiticus TaxID=573024 RepID=A0A1N7HMT6_9RHOB|nr:response regulator [Roseovarius nanhaiticus]SEL37100.1 Response regulator receiver domain-containing protein [Roseovarius nanhaiticus]SIS26195.1 Response regulator receiver domain-containing protein [Roseovarius nanhaiticus]